MHADMKAIVATVAVGVAVVVVVVLGFSAFRFANPWFGGWEEAAISDVRATADGGGRLSIATGCREGQDIELSETSEEVRLLLRVRGEHQGDCNTYVDAELRRPLGDRPVVDEHTERVVVTDR